jgi:hypothetical protein
MLGRARLWSAAVLVSALAHGALLGVVALAVAPAPTTPQAAPGTRLAISTQVVERQEAPPVAPASERPDQPLPERARLDGAAVPVSRARPAALGSPDAVALVPEGTALEPRAAPGFAAAVVGASASEILTPVEREAIAGVAAASAAVRLEAVGPVGPAAQALQSATVSASVRARPMTPSPAQAQTAAQIAARAAAVAPGAVSALVASAQGALVDAAAVRGSQVNAPSQPRRPIASVALDESAAVALDVPRPMRVAAIEGAERSAAQRLPAPADAVAFLAPVTTDAGETVALAEFSRPVRTAARLPETVPLATDVAVPAVAARAASGTRQSLTARDPGATAMVLHGPGSLAAPAPLFTPETARLTAALAWSGAEDGGAVDPVSLAAIQSFLRPSDAARDESTVQDGISSVLSSVPCARLQTVFRPETGQLELRGHIPEEGLRTPVIDALRAQVGGSIPLADNMLVLPRPICGALSGIASVGLAQSLEQARDPRIVGPSAHARVYHFVDGDRLYFELTGPDYPAYFYIDYFDADGMVLHLQPNEIVRLARIGAKETLMVGQVAQGQPALDIRVAPPFGQEILVAFASSVPLYDGLRPVREPADPYLDFLRMRVEQARASHPGFKGEWVYFFVSTQAR